MIQDNPTIVHIISSEVASVPLKQADLPGNANGNLIIWQDSLYEGPVPACMRREELYRLRAEMLANQGWAAYYQILAQFTERDHALNNARAGEYVLWFAANLHEQLQLIQALDTLAQLNIPAERISLIYLNAQPGRQYFTSLAQLRPDDFIKLFATRPYLSQTNLSFATNAWRIFSGADATQLLSLEDSNKECLPFLKEAFIRLAQEYPYTTNGLSLSQSRILKAVSERPANAQRIFQIISDEEKYPYLSERAFYASLDTLLEAPTPLLAVENSPIPETHARFTLTTAGKEVLACKKDHLALNGIARWIGGVRLRSGTKGWRYNEELVSLMPIIM